MTDKTFEEFKANTLSDREIMTDVSRNDIKYLHRNCLDKQKVRDVIHKYCSSQLMLHNLETEMFKDLGLSQS